MQIDEVKVLSRAVTALYELLVNKNEKIRELKIKIKTLEKKNEQLQNK